MCEYCEGISNPISLKYNLGLMIKDNKIKVFVKKIDKKQGLIKEIIFERKISFCPFCGGRLGDENEHRNNN